MPSNTEEAVIIITTSYLDCEESWKSGMLAGSGNPRHRVVTNLCTWLKICHVTTFSNSFFKIKNFINIL